MMQSASGRVRHAVVQNQFFVGMSVAKVTKSDGSSQTQLEDQVDALRINPFLVQRQSKDQAKATSNHHRQSYQQFAVHQRSVLRPVAPSLEDECYAFDHDKRGICLLIENDQFLPSLQLSGRRGSEVDLKAANDSFTALGFEVHIHRNLPYTDLMKLLERTANMDHSRYDCFALIILSHGNQGTVYAYDAAFPTQKLWEPFTVDNAPTLGGKPKLFFLQACQGVMMDEGVPVLKSTTATDSVFASYKVPIHSDFLIAHSTISGYYSWRNTVQGSWFIQSLTRILDEHALKRDLVTMLTMTSKRVAREYESSSSREEFNNKKQTPFFYSTLTQKLYFDQK